MPEKTYDYIIVGAGSAGCVLARRLTEDPDICVLLIEAGGQDSDPWIKIPLVWMRKFVQERRHDWGYDTEPEPHMADREIECVRARVLGGCSSINAMTYVRGNAGDYNRWAATGLDGWAYKDVLPYFKRGESWQGGADDYRGGEGPLYVRPSSYQDPLFDAYLAAVDDADLGRTDDYNGARQEGFSRGQQNIKDGRRFSAADAYLRPALGRANLSLSLNTLITHLVIEGSRAVGVAVRGEGGSVREIRAEREVIVSAGALNSPHLLMLSGIGPSDQLREQEIDVRVDLPAVGQNLQDHISAGAHFQRKSPGPFVKNTRFDRLAVNIPRAYLTGKGPATDFPGGLTGFLKTERSLDAPDLQFLFWGAPATSGPWFPGIKAPWQDGFGCRAVLLHPESRGSIELVSADPGIRPRLRQNFLSTQKDTDSLRKGFRLVRELSAGKALDRFRGNEMVPGPDAASDAEIDAHMRQTGISVHHPCGSCRMGADEGSVVDGDLKLRGVDGLRVVDASVMPDIVSGNIHAAVLMIAEKAADKILGKDPLPAATL